MIRIKPLRLAKTFFNYNGKSNNQFTSTILRSSSHSVSSNDNSEDKKVANGAAISGAADRNNSFTGRNSRFYIYPELSKYRLSALVVVTSGAGFLCAGAPIDVCTMIAATVGTGLCASSAGTFNQVIEQGHDAKMLRTRLRPLPSGRISTNEALTWGVSSGLAGTALLYTGKQRKQIQK